MEIFSWILVAGLIWLCYFLFFRGYKEGISGTNTAGMICPNCGTKANPKKIVRGSLAIEIILWLCLLVPGLIYSIWRLSSKYEACPACGQKGMIPVSTPVGAKLAADMTRHSRPADTISGMQDTHERL